MTASFSIFFGVFQSGLEQRLRVKGDPDASMFHFTYYGNKPSNCMWDVIGISESFIDGDWTTPVTFHDPRFRKEDTPEFWKYAMEKLCDVLEIPKSKIGWHIVARWEG